MKNSESDFTLQELATQLIDTLCAALYFAGAKKDRLDDALQAYEELLDSENIDENSEFGAYEMIDMIKKLRQTRKDLFVQKD